MRVSRVIFALLMCLSLLVSLAPAGVGTLAQGETCCGEKPDGDDQGKGCDSTACARPCCRLIPVQADAVPPLAKSIHVTLDAPALPPAPLHSLTDREAIFHPPRA